MSAIVQNGGFAKSFAQTPKVSWTDLISFLWHEVVRLQCLIQSFFRIFCMRRTSLEYSKMNKLLSYLLKKPIEFYRRFISPCKAPCCRFYPTCSEYALLSIEKHGPLKGLLKACWRILRCNPFSKGGIDMPWPHFAVFPQRCIIQHRMYLNFQWYIPKYRLILPEEIIC